MQIQCGANLRGGQRLGIDGRAGVETLRGGKIAHCHRFEPRVSRQLLCYSKSLGIVGSKFDPDRRAGWWASLARAA